MTGSSPNSQLAHDLFKLAKRGWDQAFVEIQGNWLQTAVLFGLVAKSYPDDWATEDVDRRLAALLAEINRAIASLKNDRLRYDCDLTFPEAAKLLLQTDRRRGRIVPYKVAFAEFGAKMNFLSKATIEREAARVREALAEALLDLGSDDTSRPATLAEVDSQHGHDAAIPYVRLESPTSIHPPTSPYSLEQISTVKFSKSASVALNNACRSCQQLNRKYVTPHLLVALLDLPNSKVAECFETTRIGLVQDWRDENTYHWTPAPAGTYPKFEDFEWDRRPEVRTAKRLALQHYLEYDYPPYATELHLLLGVLEKHPSRTRRRLKQELGESGFDRLRGIAFRMLYEEETPEPETYSGQ